MYDCCECSFLIHCFVVLRLRGKSRYTVAFVLACRSRSFIKKNRLYSEPAHLTSSLISPTSESSIPVLSDLYVKWIKLLVASASSPSYTYLVRGLFCSRGCCFCSMLVSLSKNASDSIAVTL